MDHATIDSVEQTVKAWFPGDVLQRVEVLQYGDDPAIEPGRVGVRVLIDPERVPEGGKHPLQKFHHANEASIERLRQDLEQLAPEAMQRLEFTDGRKHLFLAFGAAEEGPRGLTAVMARLGPVDLETLDTLITAGVAPNRAEAVRWILARIRERPAYEQLRERARELDELKAQL
jgi:hypothetical protein